MECFVRSSQISASVRAEKKLSIGVEVYGSNDGPITSEVVRDVLCFQLRESARSSIVICTTIRFLREENVGHIKRALR